MTNSRTIRALCFVFALCASGSAQTSNLPAVVPTNDPGRSSVFDVSDHGHPYLASVESKPFSLGISPHRTVTPIRKGQIGQPGGPQGGIGSAGAANAAAGLGSEGGVAPFDMSRMDATMLQKAFDEELSPLENPNISVSQLDLKAPGKARKEYDQGFKLLLRKQYQDAVTHLSLALSIYPNFVAAHNSLGGAYLNLGQNDLARAEFSKAVSLDDHLPISQLNLGCAELALKHYPEAEAAVQKAASIAPLDLQVLTALAYAQLLNHDYSGTVSTAKQVHSRKHKEAAIVHFYAAAAWDALNNQQAAQQELQALLKEAPKSPAASQASAILQQMKAAPEPQTIASLRLTTTGEIEPAAAPVIPAGIPSSIRKQMQDSKEAQQIAEAEAVCESCSSTAASQPQLALANTTSGSMVRNGSTWTLHKDVDEVAVFFSATDHERAVTDLNLSEVRVLDGNHPPLSVQKFRRESELPLRVGLVIDTSESVIDRFAFEQSAAANFVRKILVGKDDSGFVVGFSNSVLLVQDFTRDVEKLSQAIGKLAPGGGTALWDAVSFTADKLASQAETQPVAKVLIVISDGEDNSSSVSLRETIAAAEKDDVIVYAVSTRDQLPNTGPTIFSGAPVGDRALRALSTQSGGTAFFPGSLRNLNKGLDELQEVIRSRYMISYRPASFRVDGQYHAIDIEARKRGHKLRVYSRKGYYAKSSSRDGGL